MEDLYYEADSPYAPPEDYLPVEQVDPRVELAAEVARAAFALVSACQGRSSREVAEFASLIRTADAALDLLDNQSRETILSVVECLEFETVENAGIVDLAHLPSAAIYTPEVRTALARAATAGNDDRNPAASWLAVMELVARERTRYLASTLVKRIEARDRTERVVEAFRAITPPTARKGTVRTRPVRSAAQVAADAQIRAASAPARRFSSGYRSLDVWLTNKETGEPTGFIAPGEGVVIAAGTGQGKSSFSYRLVPALALDLINWGLSDAKVYFAHTEESSETKVKAMELGPGQRYHSIAENVIVADVGSSRETFIMGLYDLVVDAFRSSQETGRPITDFLPHIVVLDYQQSLSGEGENNVVDSTYKTAELILRGIQAWNPEEMRKFSGVDFATYAGMAWPQGMDDHRVATVCFAQLVKAAGNTGPYRPGAKGVQISDYTILDANGDPVWEPKDGDQPVLGKNAIFGSSTILNNATFIVFLHRSNIFAGRTTGEDGLPHLTDTRARLILDKMRNGALSNVVPMAFDSQPSGFRGQYFDPLGEKALLDGRFSAAEGWRESGDPMLPIRPVTRPLVGYSYR